MCEEGPAGRFHRREMQVSALDGTTLMVLPIYIIRVRMLECDFQLPLIIYLCNISMETLAGCVRVDLQKISPKKESAAGHYSDRLGGRWDSVNLSKRARL